MYSVESVNGLQLNTKYNQYNILYYVYVCICMYVLCICMYYVYHLPINEHIALIPSSYKSVFKSLYSILLGEI